MKTRVVFLVNESDTNNHDLFAYFPDSKFDLAGKYNMCYSHVGQHGGVCSEYVKESRMATPEEFADLKAELINSIGYDLVVCNKY